MAMRSARQKRASSTSTMTSPEGVTEKKVIKANFFTLSRRSLSYDT